MIYTVSFAPTSFTNANGDYDICELTPADDQPIEVIGWVIAVVSEIGDAQEEFLQVSWASDNATSGNGTSTTPRPTNSRFAAAGFTAETVGSTVASTGSAITIENFTIPARGGDRVWYPDGCGPRIDQGDTMLCMRLGTALTDDATVAGTIWVLQV